MATITQGATDEHLNLIADEALSNISHIGLVDENKEEIIYIDTYERKQVNFTRIDTGLIEIDGEYSWFFDGIPDGWADTDSGTNTLTITGWRVYDSLENGKDMGGKDFDNPITYEYKGDYTLNADTINFQYNNATT